MCQVVLASRKLGQSWTENLLRQRFFCSQSRGTRDRDPNVVHSLRDRENHQKILERKVDSAIRGERLAQQKLYEPEAEVEARNWEKINSDTPFQEINPEIESQRFQLQQANQWAGQAQRDEISLCGDFGIEK